MSLDTPSGESGELSIDAAATVFTTLLDPPVEKEEETKVDTEIDPPKEPEKEVEPPEPVEEGADAPLTIEVDGKQVTLTKEQIAEAYKNGLRQSDYTQKTTALAEQRKAAEAEAQKAFQERQTYATNLQKMAAQLEGAIQQQEKIDWQALLRSDPVEYLEQQRLYQERQAALGKTQQEASQLQARDRAEQSKSLDDHIQMQREELLAKLPEWKDEAKAKAEQTAIVKFLIDDLGYPPDQVMMTRNPDGSIKTPGITDHKAIVLARESMLYRQMMAKASAAAKKVQNLPTKVERPGVSTERNPLDGRMKAMKRLEGSGSIDDAAALFSSLL